MGAMAKGDCGKKTPWKNVMAPITKTTIKPLNGICSGLHGTS